jgi:hypothetical protein
MIDTDMQQEQQTRVNFLQAVGGFLTQAVQVGQSVPALIPLIGQMISFGVRGFKIGRELEAAIDTAMEKLEQMASQPQQPPPNPELLKVQQEGELAKMKENNQFSIKKMELESAERIAIMNNNAKFGVAIGGAAAEAAQADLDREHEASQNDLDRQQQQQTAEQQAAAQPEVSDAA